MRNDCTNDISEIFLTELKTIKNLNIKESRREIVLTMKTPDRE